MNVDSEEGGSRVDINSASVEDFVSRLKGVGHYKANAIVRFRTTVGKFKKLCELTDVPGITTQILEKNQHVLLCLSSRSKNLANISANNEVGNEDLPQTSIIFSELGESGGENSLNLNRQDQVRWKRNLNETFSSDENVNENKDIRQVIELDTPSTSTHNFENIVTSSSSTPIMPTYRSRSRSKNEERTFGMSTRSTPSHAVQFHLVDLDMAESSHSNIVSSPPTSSNRGGKNKKTVTDKSATRVRYDRTRSSGTLDTSSQLDHFSDETRKQWSSANQIKASESKLHTKSMMVKLTAVKVNKCNQKRHTRDVHEYYQMKRKLEKNPDLGKFDTPLKKQCRSIQSLDKSVARTPVSPPKPEGLPDWLNHFERWNSMERLNALDTLINICEPRQVRHMLEVIEPQFQRDFISLLPKELALYVLSFLEPKDLLIAAQTCHYWHILAEDNVLWRHKCVEEGIREPYYPKLCRGSLRAKKGCTTTRPSEWKISFLHQHQIETNWRNGSHKPAKLLKGHDDHVITCLQFNGTRIVSGSDDNTLKVWSAISGKCLKTLIGHTGGVWASQMRKNMIISGSTDRTLKIWNADTGACVHTLYGHTSTVRCMALHDNTVVSGSRDATLRVWNIDTGDCLHVLAGHMAAVRCVCYDGKRVVSGAYDYNVKVWDPFKEECLHTLEGHTNRVYSLQFDGTHVVSGSLDTLIKVWSVETGQCLHTLVGHQSLTSGMELKNNILVSGNADSTVKMWDIVSGDCLKTLEGPQKHMSAVTCLQFCGKFVITSSDDGTVKLWDVKSGKVIRNLVSLDSRGSGGVVWRIRATPTKLVCAVGSRNGTEETKLLVLDFDPDAK